MFEIFCVSQSFYCNIIIKKVQLVKVNKNCVSISNEWVHEYKIKHKWTFNTYDGNVMWDKEHKLIIKKWISKKLITWKLSTVLLVF